MTPKTSKKTVKTEKPQRIRTSPKRTKAAPLIQTETAVITPPEPQQHEEIPREESGGRFWEAVGRRKTAVARVRLFARGDRGIWVNGKPHQHYFQYPFFADLAEDPLKKMKSEERFRITAKISGGGIHAQAEALRHAISRALVAFNPDFRKRLKRAGYLTRDPRMKERKKFGLKGARRAPQWQKR